MTRFLVLQQPSSTSPVDQWIRAECGDAEITVVTGTGSHRLPQPASDSATTWHELPDYFADDNTSRLVEIAEAFEPDIIVSNAEHDVARAGLLRSLRGLRGANSRLALAFRDKVAMKLLFQSAEIPAVPWREVSDVESLLEAIASLGDVIVKPRDGAGSQGVVRLQSAEAALDHARRDPRFLAALADRRLMVEEYIVGEVFHVDALVDGMRLLLFSPSRYGYPPHTYAEHDVWSSMVDKGSKDYVDLRTATEALVRSLPKDHGISLLHFELYRRADGTLLAGEVGARLGGGMIKASIKQAFGVDLSHEGYLQSCGLGRVTDEVPRKDAWGFLLWTRSTPPDPEQLPEWAQQYWVHDRNDGTPRDSTDCRGGVLVCGANEVEIAERIRSLTEETR